MAMVRLSPEEQATWDLQRRLGSGLLAGEVRTRNTELPAKRELGRPAYRSESFGDPDRAPSGTERRVGPSDGTAEPGTGWGSDADPQGEGVLPVAYQPASGKSPTGQAAAKQPVGPVKPIRPGSRFGGQTAAPTANPYAGFKPLFQAEAARTATPTAQKPAEPQSRFVGKGEATPANPYAVFGGLFRAEQEVLTLEEQQALNARRAEGKGKPLSAAQRRLADRAEEKVAAALGRPFSPLELKRRRLFGPGTINPRTLEEAGRPSAWMRVENATNAGLTPTGAQREAQSYDVYRDQAARDQAAAPPQFSDQPQFRAAQEQDLQRIRAWVGENLPKMVSNAARVDLTKEPNHPWAGVKRRYLERFALMESPEGAKAIGVKTQFGRQLLKAIAAERRARMPWLIREARAAGQDMTINGIAGGLGLLTGGAADLYLAGPGLAVARTLGPAAKLVPAMVDGGVGGGFQQAGTAYAGGERDPRVLAGEAGKGTGAGILAGFLGGLLPANSMTPIQRAVAQANLEVETAELTRVLQRVSVLSREGQAATRRLAQVHAQLAELEELGVATAARKSPSPEPIPPPKGRSADGEAGLLDQLPGQPGAPAQATPGSEIGHRSGAPGSFARGIGSSSTGLTEPIRGWLDQLEGTARARLTQRARSRRGGKLGSLAGGLSDQAEDLPEWAVIGGVRMARGALDRTVWANEMAQEFGEAIRPHLDRVWPAAREYHEHELQPLLAHLKAAEGPVLFASKEVKQMRIEKKALDKADFAKDEVQKFVARYFDPAKKKYEALRGKNVVFLVMPSTSGRNTIPEEFARQLQQEFGGDIVSRFAEPLSIKQAKLKNVKEKLESPSRYRISADLSHFRGRELVVVDDVLNTGDSLMGLRQALQDAGLDASGIAVLGAAEANAASAKDLARLAKKMAAATGKDETQIRRDIYQVFRGGIRKFTGDWERALNTHPTWAETFYEVVRREAAALRANARRVDGVEPRPGTGGEPAGAAVRLGGVSRTPGLGAKPTGRTGGAGTGSEARPPGLSPRATRTLQQLEAEAQERLGARGSAASPGSAGELPPAPLAAGAAVEYRTREGVFKRAKVLEQNPDGTYRLSNGIRRAPLDRLRPAAESNSPGAAPRPEATKKPPRSKPAAENPTPQGQADLLPREVRRVVNRSPEPGNRPAARDTSLPVGTWVDYTRRDGLVRRSRIVEVNPDGTYQLRNGIARAVPARLAVVTA